MSKKNQVPTAAHAVKEVGDTYSEILNDLGIEEGTEPAVTERTGASGNGDEKSSKKNNGKKKNSRVSKGEKTVIAILSIIIIIAVAGFSIFYFVFNGKQIIANINGIQGDNSQGNSGDALDNVEAEDYEIESINVLRGDSSLSENLKSWANSTDKSQLMRSPDVKNYLLAGIDNGGSNADVIMLCSVNTKTKKIYLTSIMRDSYTYIKAENGSDVYFKINSSFYYGGVKTLVETFQNDFKIKIDNYATVRFGAFADIVDELGGIDLEVQYYEAREIDTIINREYTEKYDPCPYSSDGSTVHLDGVHALTFCRIRHCYYDADVHRTLNQRKFISALIDRSKSANLTTATSIIAKLIGYTKTDMSKDDLMSVISEALTNRWYSYEIMSSCFPEETERLDYAGTSWVWIVDYPAAAQKMQELIFGETNITLSDSRVSAIDIMKNTGDKGDAGI